MRRLLLVPFLLVAGCLPTTEQVQTLTNDVDELMVVVDEVQEHIVIVNEAIKERAKETFESQAKGAIEASRPFNPYADEMAAILGLTTIIGGLWARGKNKKYQAHKSGAELFSRDHPDVAGELYKDIGNARRGNGVS